MDFDMTWKNPTEAQIAALGWAESCKDLIRSTEHRGEGEWHPPITEFHVAETMCMADKMLWYTQAKSWAEGNVPYKERLPGDAVKALTACGKAIVALVDHGYQDGKWYDPVGTWEDSAVAAFSLTFIFEGLRILDEVETKLFSGLGVLFMEEDSIHVTSSWLRKVDMLLVPYYKRSRARKLLKSQHGSAVLVSELRAKLDEEWRKKHNAAVREVKEKRHETYEPTECIHPECHNLVAPSGIEPREGHHKNYRGTGACQAGHNSYWCTKCKSPHSFESKVGKAHCAKYNGGNWTKETKEKVGWEG